MTMPNYIKMPLTARYKIMAELNIAERRLPQDGRIGIRYDNKDYDLRVSCLPNLHGEKIVMRILDKSSVMIGLNKLGFTAEVQSQLEELSQQPNGMLLSTGPTGSGKTTTQYSLLNKLNSIEKNILTIEDPCEYQLGGITQVQDDTIRVAFHSKDKNYEYTPPSAHITAPVTLPQTIFADAFAFVRDNVSPGQTAKLTIPSPSMVHYRGGRDAIDKAVYPDLDPFWDDLAAAYAQELRQLHDLGCRYVQLDDTSLAYVNDPAQREHIREIGGDPLHQHETYIATINKALANRPAGLTVTTHMCRGNNQSMWAAEGGYDFVADSLFNKLDVDGFFCEWDDERSGGFEPLRYLPKGKRVVLGVVTSKRGELESKDFIKRRIEEAARYTDIDQLSLSAQCGFSSTSEGNDLTEQQQWDKLRLIVEVAEEIWGE